ncbi:50S ribosomal protein L32e [archaeon]|nr:50S ribosomal protein L32e [archaeon]
MTPKFTRQNSHRKKRLGTKWRKPRGIDSKQKQGKKAKGAKPRIGYGKPKTEKPTLIRNITDLEKAQGKITIASIIGNKKREEIIKQAEQKKLEITNR